LRSSSLPLLVFLLSAPASAGPLVSAQLTLTMQGYGQLTVTAPMGAAAGSFTGFVNATPGGTVFGPFSFSAGSVFAGSYSLPVTQPSAVPTLAGLPYLVPRIVLGSATRMDGDAVGGGLLEQGGGFAGSFGWSALPPFSPGPSGAVALPLGHDGIRTASVFTAGILRAAGGAWAEVAVQVSGVSITTPMPFLGGSGASGGLVSINRVAAVKITSDLPISGPDTRFLFGRLELVYQLVPEPSVGLLFLSAALAVGVFGRSRGMASGLRGQGDGVDTRRCVS
jgi:hypothetical protein